MHYVEQLDLRFGSKNDDCVTGDIAKTGENLLYVAVFSHKNELFVEVKVDIEYHRYVCVEPAIGICEFDIGIFAGHVVCLTV